MGLSQSVSLELSRTPAAPSIPASGPIDRAHLARFTFGNVALELEVLNLFAQQAPESFASLAGASSPKAWRDAAHTLKGSARAVGAWRVANVTEMAERIEWTEVVRRREQLLAEIRVTLDEAITYVSDLAPQG